MLKQNDTPFVGVKYDLIFNNKVRDVLESDDVKDAIERYVRRYNDLLEASTFFKRGVFDYYNAGEIAKTVSKNGFFDANHTVNLRASGKSHEISTEGALEKVIEEEKRTILQDKALRVEFDKVSKRLDRNVDLRACVRYLQENEYLLSQMNNIPKFRVDVLNLISNFTKVFIPTC